MFYDRFIELCEKKAVSRTKACTDCNVSRTAWRKWADGATPNGTTLNSFSSYFGVSVGYLLGEAEQKEKTPASAGAEDTKITDENLKFALWGDTSNIDDADLEDVRRYAAFIAERKKGNQ